MDARMDNPKPICPVNFFEVEGIKTSMSACIYIQPYPFMNELNTLMTEDGLLDGFLVCSARPVFHETKVIQEKVKRKKKKKKKTLKCCYVKRLMFYRLLIFGNDIS